MGTLNVIMSIFYDTFSSNIEVPTIMRHALYIFGASIITLKKLTPLMLKREQAGAWATRVDTHTPIVAQPPREFQKVTTAERAISGVALALAVGFKVSGQMTSGGMRSSCNRSSILSKTTNTL
jgi:hypothetical protein